MDRRTKICIWIILLGLANFVAYTMIYMLIGGEAVYGHIEKLDGGKVRCVLQSGHDVPRWVFIYSGIHSISIWPTMAAIMLAMLTLAKERIVSSMRSTIVRGRTFITILATVITFLAIVITIWFTLHFVTESVKARPPRRDQPATEKAEQAARGTEALAKLNCVSHRGASRLG